MGPTIIRGGSVRRMKNDCAIAEASLLIPTTFFTKALVRQGGVGRGSGVGRGRGAAERTTSN